MKRKLMLGAIVVICCYILTISAVSPKKLYGKWYLYNGNDISTDKNIVKQLNKNDYIEISADTIKDFRSDGKNGVAAYSIRGNKMHNGDAVYKYEINNIEKHKVLVLKLVEYDDGHTKQSVKNGDIYTYVLDENVDIE